MAAILQARAENEGKRPTPTQIGGQHSLRRKAVAPTWIAWTLISLACLLFVFIAPAHYCIQAESDLNYLKTLPYQNGYYHEAVDNKRLGECFSKAAELVPIRNSLKDLYSFSIINVLFKLLFMFIVYRNWKKELSRQKKVVIYVEGPDTPTTPTYQNPEEVEITDCEAGRITGAGVEPGDAGPGVSTATEEKSAYVPTIIVAGTKQPQTTSSNEGATDSRSKKP